MLLTTKLPNRDDNVVNISYIYTTQIQRNIQSGIKTYGTREFDIRDVEKILVKLAKTDFGNSKYGFWYMGKVER